MIQSTDSIEELSRHDLVARISTLQERLVSFYAIQSDIECEEAKEVLQVQIDNYQSALVLFQNELQRRTD